MVKNINKINYVSSCCESSFTWTYECYGICDKCKNECDIVKKIVIKEITLSKESQKQLDEIRKEIDNDFSQLWTKLDFILHDTPYTHKDVCFDNKGFYVVNRKTDKKIRLENI